MSGAGARGFLSGIRVLVTRPAGQASRLSTALVAEGAEVLELPTIHIDPPLDWTPVDTAIQAGHYDWVVFTSANGVDRFFERLATAGAGSEWFSMTRVAAIGPETAAHLGTRGVRPALVPNEYVAEALVAEMVSFVPLTGRTVLLPGAEIARDTLAVGLSAAGATVDRVTAYRTSAPEPPPAILAQLRSGSVQAATFTSASTVTNLVAMLGRDAEVLNRMVLACIGPVTADAARRHGFEPTITAATYTIPGLVAAMRGYYFDKPGGFAPN